jgi:hypothetical protein
VQKLIISFDEEKRGFINDILLKHLTELINDTNGISVVSFFCFNILGQEIC